MFSETGVQINLLIINFQPEKKRSIYPSKKTILFVGFLAGKNVLL